MTIYIYTCIHPVQTDKPNSDPPNVKSLAETALFRFSGPKVEDGWNFSQIARAPAEFLWVIDLLDEGRGPVPRMLRNIWNVNHSHVRLPL